MRRLCFEQPKRRVRNQRKESDENVLINDLQKSDSALQVCGAVSHLKVAECRIRRELAFAAAGETRPFGGCLSCPAGPS